MKTVMAFISINKMNKTKRALAAAGVSSMTATGNVFGRGKGLWDAKVMEAAQNDVPEAIEHLGKEPRMRPQRILTITVSDGFVEPTVQAIIQANQTGEHGDGKIFVLPEMEAIQIRTGVTGNPAID